ALCASLSSRWPQVPSLRPAQGNLHGTDMTLITAHPFGPRSDETVVAPGGFEPLAQPRGCASSRGDPARGSASPVQGSRGVRSSRHHATGPTPLSPSLDSNQHRYSRTQESNLPPWGSRSRTAGPTAAAAGAKPCARSPADAFCKTASHGQEKRLAASRLQHFGTW